MGAPFREPDSYAMVLELEKLYDKLGAGYITEVQLKEYVMRHYGIDGSTYANKKNALILFGFVKIDPYDEGSFYINYKNTDYHKTLMLKRELQAKQRGLTDFTGVI